MVAGPLSLYMYRSGKFTHQEAIDYTFYSRYPKHWYRPDA
jgi:hypothetical protein